MVVLELAEQPGCPGALAARRLPLDEEAKMRGVLALVAVQHLLLQQALLCGNVTVAIVVVAVGDVIAAVAVAVYDVIITVAAAVDEVAVGAVRDALSHNIFLVHPASAALFVLQAK